MVQRSIASLVALLMLGSGPALTESRTNDLLWSHLNITPSTKQERLRVRNVLDAPIPNGEVEDFEALPGGAATGNKNTGKDAFSQPSANMSFEQKLEFQLGNALFEKLWVFSPSSTKASDGLGPLYNARACQSCHIRDGRGAAPKTGVDRGSLLFKIGVPQVTEDPTASPTYAPDPVYGGQLQDRSLPGLPPEGQINIGWQPQPVTLDDGTVVTLREPDHQVRDLGWGPMSNGARLSPRIAPQMIGLGLIEAIPADQILSAADPDDRNGDGISGRANLAWSDTFRRNMLGRFGLKAASPTIRDQSAAAFSSDIGISSPTRRAPWGDCTTAQRDCRAAPHGDGDIRDTEIDDAGLELVTFYSRNLAVPARRDVDAPQVVRGKEVFHQSGCALCHRSKFVTHTLPDQPEQSFQLIWPYSDFLLHDMGDGLTDGVPDGEASGREWRTPPLWGIGLTQAVSPDAGFLHDGRARTMLEAILWHGGEATPARDTVISLPTSDRKALLRFLSSL